MASHTHVIHPQASQITANMASQPSDSKIEEIISSTDSHSQQIDQIATDRKWFRPQEDSNFYPTVQNFVYGKINAEEASAKLFGPIDDAITSERLDDVNFGDLWYSIIHSARRISHHERELHEKVVDLVSAFKHHSVLNNEKYDYLYQSLPDFGMSCREAYNDAPQLDKGFSQIEVDAWANLNFFFSLITARELEDLSLYAIWAMRQALEDVPQDEPRHSAAQSYDTYIPAAAVWIIGLGPTLFRLEKDLTPTDRKQGNPARGGELWKGKAEFSKERWALWKERFAAVGKMEEVNDKTKSMGRDAVEHMERAETFEPI